MGSGSASPQIPPGRPRTEIRRRQSANITNAIVWTSWTFFIGLVLFWVGYWLILLPISVNGNPTTIAAFRTPIGIEDKSDQAKRAISTGKLNASWRLHTRPINVVVFHGS